MPGYLERAYVNSLRATGRPLFMPRSGGWLLERIVPGTPHLDATGCLPFLCCADWSALAQDLTALQDRLVSVVAVADPLGRHDAPLRSAVFDYRVPYKDHFVIRTGRRLSDFVRASHRAHARRALKRIHVERCADPESWLGDWLRLYAELVERHEIPAERQTRPADFARQARVPGFVMFRGSLDGRTVALDCWYEQGDVAHAHLAAFDSVGYDLRASYATKWFAIDYFSDRVTWINLGGGVDRSGRDGLARFKRGWSTDIRTAWLCGRVLQPTTYAALCGRQAHLKQSYFPAYRDAATPEAKAPGGPPFDEDAVRPST